MGRGHESDLRINDISVSRCHALIKYKDNKFLLEDNLSKFGTLVLVKNKTNLVPGFNKAVQVGRTVINFSVKSSLASGKIGEASKKISKPVLTNLYKNEKDLLKMPQADVNLNATGMEFDFKNAAENCNYAVIDQEEINQD